MVTLKEASEISKEQSLKVNKINTSLEKKNRTGKERIVGEYTNTLEKSFGLESSLQLASSIGKAMLQFDEQVRRISEFNTQKISVGIDKSMQLSSSIGKAMLQFDEQVRKLSEFNTQKISVGIDKSMQLSSSIGKAMLQFDEQVKRLSEFDTQKLSVGIDKSMQLSSGIGKAMLQFDMQVRRLSEVGIGKSSQMTSNIGAIALQLDKQLSMVPYEKINLALDSISQKGIEVPNDLVENIKKVTDIKIKTSEIIEFNADSELNQEDLLISDTQNVYEWINELCRKIINFPTELKTKRPFFYIIYHLGLVVIIWNVIIVPYMQESMKNEVFQTRELEHISVKNNITYIKVELQKQQVYDNSLINKVRITNRETNIYKSNRRKSGMLDTIPMNTPVIILDKKKNWSYIIYKGENDLEMNGWVFTKNLIQ